VRLGDGHTIREVNQYVDLVLSFPHKDAYQQGRVRFYLFYTGYTVILGLRDILVHYCEFLCAQLLAASHLLRESDIPSILSLMYDDLGVPTDDLLDPWSTYYGPSPEELSSPEVELGHHILEYQARPYVEALREFNAYIPQMIPDELVRSHLQSLPFFPPDGSGFTSVCLPAEWHGIYPSALPHLLPLEVETLSNLPAFNAVKPRPVPHKMREAFDKEWSRLKSYLYMPHSGPYSSPLVVAAKKTAPFIRIAADLRGQNPFIARVQEPMPNVIEVLHEVANYKYLVDADCTNSYHQLPLGPKTSSLLSVSAPDGQFRPLFMPEGAGPASGWFQRIARALFADMPWVKVVIDNIIFGADTLEELTDKLTLFFRRCDEVGLIIKQTKTKIGVSTTNFFGYEVGNGVVKMDSARIRALQEHPFPTNVSQMRSFLGSANFFLRHVKLADVAAPLHDATSNAFDWKNPDTVEALRPHFQAVIAQCVDAVALHVPDYNLPWILRTDASTVACGAVLCQQYPASHTQFPGLLAPIAVCSHKFSDPATRWSTYEQEAYGIVYAVSIAFKNLLYGKAFVIETDHANLRYMDKSEVSKIVRWRLALQEYDFLIRHIPGRLNTVADDLSRMYSIGCVSTLDRPSSFPAFFQDISDPAYIDKTHYSRDPILCDPCDTSATTWLHTYGYGLDSLEDAFGSVHNSRVGHHGAERTHTLLDRYYPGHSVPLRIVKDMVLNCPLCQKFRKTQQPLPSMIQHLETFDYPMRGNVGVDVLQVKKSKLGNEKIVAFVVHDTKRVRLFPVPADDELSVARAMYSFICQEGLYRGFATDPGSSFLSNCVRQLNAWLPMLHKVSLVDRHESNGVESTNNSVLRHLRVLVQDERAVDFWDQPEYYLTVESILNSYSDYEFGLSPNELTFGSPSALYFQLPPPLSDPHLQAEYLQNLNDYLRIARSASEEFHRSVLADRKKTEAHIYREYQPNELVLWIPNPRSREHKLTPTLLGTYRVLHTNRSDVTCQQLATGKQHIFHVSRLRPYTGPDDHTAFELACRDGDQYQISRILGYRGDPLHGRSYCTFLTQFADGDQCWLRYGPDLSETIAFADFIDSKPELIVLNDTVRFWGNALRECRSRPITQIHHGDIFYLNLRALGFTWYDSLNLPDSDTTDYFVEATFLRHSSNPKRGFAFIPLLDRSPSCRPIAADWLLLHAKNRSLPPDSVLIREDNIALYPQVQHTYFPTEIPKSFTPAIAGTPAERRGSYHSRSPRSPSRAVSDRSAQTFPATVSPNSTSAPKQPISSSPRILRRSPRLS
jgi:hypothetical protein